MNISTFSDVVLSSYRYLQGSKTPGQFLKHLATAYDASGAALWSVDQRNGTVSYAHIGRGSTDWHAYSRDYSMWQPVLNALPLKDKDPDLTADQTRAALNSTMVPHALLAVMHKVGQRKLFLAVSRAKTKKVFSQDEDASFTAVMAHLRSGIASVHLDATQLARELESPSLPRERGEVIGCDLGNLTPAEMRVAKAIGAGHSPAEIAADGRVSREAVYFHLKNIYSKTGLKNQLALARYMSAPRNSSTSP
jgi:DNA-binding CsgD family transcriptional regulator